MKRKYFRLDPRVSPSDYQHGLLYVKLKPEYQNVTGLSNARISGSGDIMNMLDVSEIKPFIKLEQINSVRARSSKPFKYDINAYRMLRYTNTEIHVEEAINLLYRTGMFDIIEPAFIDRITYEPNDSLLSRQYYLELTNTFEAWDITRGSSKIVVAIVDSGIDRNHPDIVENLWYNEADPIDGLDNDNNGYVDDYRGWDFGGADKDNPNDEDNDPGIKNGESHSHGTSVGGLVGATPDNNKGFAGIGFNTKLLFTKHMADNQPTDELSLYNTYSGILYSASMGVDIINCSFGSEFRSQIAQDIINYVVEDLDVIVVAASGNSGMEDDNHYPSAYDNVLSVSAVDREMRKSTFTTYGNTVDITAPGSGIAVLQFDDDYGTSQGTSFSTPIVAGGLALVKAHRPGMTALQYGELIRVTANDTIYDINSSSIFKNKLGKGILDIENALKASPPSIRLMTYKLLNSEGKTPGPGEEGFFVANFKNFLWPSTSGMKVKLTSKSALFEVLENESILGKIEMNQMTSNTANPFRIKIFETIPPNTKIDLMLEYIDGDFYDYQFLTVLLNPTFLNVEENLVSSSVAQNGRIGYQDTEQSEGLGFVVDDNNILFEMGLIMGSSDTGIASNVRSENQEYDDDFEPVLKIGDLSPGKYSAAEIIGSFNNTKGDSTIQQVDISYRSLVWKEDPNDRYFIMEYKISNPNDDPVENFFVGLYADWDVSEDGQNDRALWNDSLSVGYVYNTDTDENDLNLGGIQVLTGKANYFAIDNDHSTNGNPFGVYDGFKDEEKFLSISSGIGRDSAGFASETGADVSHSVAAGPYSIASGEIITVAFAIHGATSLYRLLQSAIAADTMYNFTLKAPLPEVSSATICYNDSVTLHATGANQFNWYTTKTGGDPFFSGPQYTTDLLTSDTVFYISNADNSYESVRIPSSIELKANPEITISGSPFLCNGDTVVLIAGKADSYFWSPGNSTSQSLIVTAGGEYTVTVTDNDLNCVSTSKGIKVEELESPRASFSLDPESIDKNVETEVTLLDESLNAVNWFWSLSNGLTSTGQNPVLLINTTNAIQVNLTITADNGCQDTTSRIIDIITGIEDELISRSWKLYPNPARQSIFSELTNELSGPFSISIYDLHGKSIIHKKYLKTNKTSIEQIDISNLQAGIYILRLEQLDLGSATKRVIIR
jgi:subtilisin family serine protease